MQVVCDLFYFFSSSGSLISWNKTHVTALSVWFLLYKSLVVFLSMVIMNTMLMERLQAVICCTCQSHDTWILRACVKKIV